MQSIGLGVTVAATGVFPFISSKAYAASAVGSSLATYSQAILADSPTAYYHLDENGGRGAFDASPNGNDASYAPGIHFNQPGMLADDASVGVNGNSIYVRGNNVLSPLTGSNDRTVEMWFNTSSAGNLFHSGSFSHTQAFDIALTDFAGPGGCGNPGGVGLYLRMWDDDVFIPAPQLTDANWHYVAVTLSNNGTTVGMDIDGTRPAGYVWNGVCYTPSAQGQPFAMPFASNTAATTFTFGGVGWNDGLHGLIDEAAIYGTALNACQLDAHYAGTGPSSSIPNTRNLSAKGSTSGVQWVSYGTFANTSIDVDIGYSGGNFIVRRPLTFTVSDGVHNLSVNSTNACNSLNLSGPNNSQATFRGLANYTLNGATTSNTAFTLTATDGTRTNPASSDSYTLTVYTDSSRTTVLDSWSVNRIDKGKVKIN